jgi:hypothetical protein
MAAFGLQTFTDVYKNFDDYASLEPRFNAYSKCGVDKDGRSIFWINGRCPSSVADEALSIRAGILYFVAIHADQKSLKEGITFCIDVSSNVPEIGNEKKLQSTYQSFPLRPQRIFIIGSGYVKRLLINSLVAFASIFSKAKVLERIKFVTMDEVLVELRDSEAKAAPTYVREGREPIFPAEGQEIARWVKERIMGFPIPEIKLPSTGADDDVEEKKESR